MRDGNGKQKALAFSIQHDAPAGEGRPRRTIDTVRHGKADNQSGTSGFRDSRRQFHMFFFFFDSRCCTIFAIGPLINIKKPTSFPYPPFIQNMSHVSRYS